MKRILFLWTAAALMGLTACQKSDEVTGAGEATVTVSATLPAGMGATRAYGDGETVDRCIMAVYLDGEPYGERQTAAVSGLQATFSARLVSGKSYDLVFWADKAGADQGDLHYDTSAFPEVRFTGDYAGNDETRDAFFGTAVVEADQSKAVTVELKRPFGQLNIATLDMADVPADMQPTEVSISFESVPTGINLMTGELTEARAAVSYSVPAALVNAENGDLSVDYLFAPKTEGEQYLANFTMSFLKGGAEVASAYAFSSIPVQRNYRTNVSGYLLTKKADVTVEVKPAFEDDIEPWNGVSTKAVVPVSEEVDGVMRDVYRIAKPTEFAWVAEQLQAGNSDIKYIELVKDIDLGNYNILISTRVDHIVLDGQNHTISNYVVETNTQAAGLFCDVAGATVRNLTLRNATVKAINDGNGNAYAGALMGRTYGTIVVENVHVVDPVVEGVNKVGALVGFVAENHIEATDCTVEGGTVTTSYVEGESGQVGGFVGYLGSLFGSTCSFKNCTVSNTVINAYMTREDRTVSKFIGCFQGNQASDKVVIDNCRLDNVTLNPLDDMAASCFSPYGDLLGGQRVGKGTVEITNSETANLLSTRAQLEALASAVNGGRSFKNVVFKLTQDIDLENEPWTPIGKSNAAFQGVFDGADHVISNLYINTPAKSDVGFFGFTTQGEIRNLGFHNASVKGYLDVGVVAGTPYTSRYSNITLTGTVTVDGYSYVGGMFGKNAYADLSDLTVEVEENSYVKASSEYYRTYVGGVIGFIGEGNITVSNVVSNMDVTGSTCDVGGITGIAHYGNSFINCTSSGDVVLTNAFDAGDQLEIGGIAGVWFNQEGTKVTFSGCSFTGTLTTALNGVDCSADIAESNRIVGNAYNRGSSVGELIIE